ncbi:protein LSM12 homolog A isoform X2 [Nematostella vectensis]|nr:protein LSM12 homolog A isoform X2 [Nematostella vectensis]
MKYNGSPSLNMATGDPRAMAREAKDIPPGSLVACVTRFGEKIEGEVVAFDYASKFIVIKTPTETKGARKGNQDVRMLNMTCLQKFNIIDMGSATQNPLPPLDLDKIDKRIKANKLEKSQAIGRVGVGVTPEGQKLFDTIAKTFSEISWKDKDIVVMDRVTIVPPYKVGNMSGHDERSFTYIKEIVKKHYEQQEQTDSSAK